MEAAKNELFLSIRRSIEAIRKEEDNIAKIEKFIRGYLNSNNDFLEIATLVGSIKKNMKNGVENLPRFYRKLYLKHHLQ